jgi:hypothetical protein
MDSGKGKMTDVQDHVTAFIETGWRRTHLYRIIFMMATRAAKIPRKRGKAALKADLALWCRNRFQQRSFFAVIFRTKAACQFPLLIILFFK